MTESPTVDGEPGADGAGYVYTRWYLSGRPESGIVLSTVQVTPAALQLAVVTPVVQIVAYYRGAYCVLTHDAVRLVRAHGGDA